MKILEGIRKLKGADVLSLTIKVVNDSADPSALVQTLLVFGVLLRSPIYPKDLPDKIDRMRAMLLARAEMEKIMESTRVNVALAQNVPAAADAEISIHDEVLVYGERPVDKWMDAHTVVNVKEKMVQFNVNVRIVQFSIDKVRTCDRPGERDNGHEIEPNIIGNNDDTITPDDGTEATDVEWTSAERWTVSGIWTTQLRN